MAKFVFLLCLLVASACAEDDTVSLTAADVLDTVVEKAKEYRDELVRIIKSVIQQLTEKIKNVKDKVVDFFFSVKDKATKVKNRITQEVNDAITKIDQKIDELTGRAPGVDVTECTELAREVHETATSVVDEVRRCVTDAVAGANENVVNATQLAQDFMNKIGDIKTKTVNCTRHVDSVLKGVACLAGTVKDVYELAYQDGPAVIQAIIKSRGYVKHMAKVIATCSATKSVEVLRESFRSILPRVESCINQKIAEKEAQKQIEGVAFY